MSAESKEKGKGLLSPSSIFQQLIKMGVIFGGSTALIHWVGFMSAIPATSLIPAIKVAVLGSILNPLLAPISLQLLVAGAIVGIFCSFVKKAFSAWKGTAGTNMENKNEVALGFFMAIFAAAGAMAFAFIGSAAFSAVLPLSLPLGVFMAIGAATGAFAGLVIGPKLTQNGGMPRTIIFGFLATGSFAFLFYGFVPFPVIPALAAAVGASVSALILPAVAAIVAIALVGYAAKKWGEIARDEDNSAIVLAASVAFNTAAVAGVTALLAVTGVLPFGMAALAVCGAAISVVVNMVAPLVGLNPGKSMKKAWESHSKGGGDLGAGNDDPNPMGPAMPVRTR